VLDAIADAVAGLQQQVFEGLVQPLLFAAGWAHLLEDAHAATLWVMVGALQLAVIAVVFGALEAWRPVEPVVDRPAIRTDIVYSLVHRLGLFRLAMFFTVGELAIQLAAALRLQGWSPWQLDALWPGVTDAPLASFLLYLVVFDFVDYALHRGQHGWHRWWQLHALHHSQRQMTRWSDNRNHLLDDLLRDAVLAGVALALGVAPAQFVAIVAVTQLLESLSHANLRLDFGPVLGRLLVSPAYHRLHHAIGDGHESRGPGSLGGCNFAVLFPAWDILFGTADFRVRFQPTGIRDQLPGEGGRDYGRGFWQQQWLGLRRLVRPH
jgi:sterol desaturase/sphingolipid hydroxylase (fatty acid hydroxylase superfamily)